MLKTEKALFKDLSKVLLGLHGFMLITASSQLRIRQGSNLLFFMCRLRKGKGCDYIEKKSIVFTLMKDANLLNC